MDIDLKTTPSIAAVEKIKQFKQTHLLDTLSLIKDPRQLHDYINEIESIDYALLEQVKSFIK